LGVVPEGFQGEELGFPEIELNATTPRELTDLVGESGYDQTA
jgi:hypothetical protein